MHKYMIYPRKPDDCEKDFLKWLGNKVAAEKFYGSPDVSLQDVLTVYQRARDGVLGVGCFCGASATCKRELKISRGIGIFESYVCFCEAHAKEFDGAAAVKRELENAIYNALKKAEAQP